MTDTESETGIEPEGEALSIYQQLQEIMRKEAINGWEVLVIFELREQLWALGWQTRVGEGNTLLVRPREVKEPEE